MTGAARIRRRVLMLIPELGYGGAETSFVRLSNLLAQHHDVSIALFRRHYEGGDYTRGGGLDPQSPVLLLDEPERSSTLAQRWVRRFRKLHDLKRSHHVTVSFLSGTNLLNAITPSGNSTVVSERGSKRYDIGRSERTRWLWTHVLDRVTYRLADRITSVSRGLSSEITQALPTAQHAKVITIEGSTDSERIVAAADLPIEPELEQLAGSQLIVSCGRLHVQKGFQHLIPIFATVKRTVAGAKLLVIGDGPDQSALLALCAVHRLRTAMFGGDLASADVIFLGHRDNPNRYFRLGRAFVLSSVFEGLPNSLIEALASGVPCIAADCPWGPRSVLALDPDRWLNAVLPARMDYGTLMPAIERSEHGPIWVSELVSVLQRQPTERASRSHRLEMVQRFDMSVTGARWLDLIDDLCAGRDVAV